jgi:hypothetical protein
MLVFLSYQTKDKLIAGRIAAFFESIGIETFLAHENIKVTQRWQEAILDNLSKMDIFVAIVSDNYCDSDYCLQESGVAMLRANDITIAPLSLDDTVPPGFMSHIQAAKIDGKTIDRSMLFSIVANQDVGLAIDHLIDRLSNSKSYAEAERRFEMLSPYLGHADKTQIINLLKAGASNSQIWACWACQPSLRALLKSHGKFLSKKDREDLAEKLS